VPGTSSGSTPTIGGGARLPREALLGPVGFVRIHRSLLVNPRRVRELRRRSAGDGWEVVMEPPDRVLPVSDERLAALRERFA
jgi:DNA-binding LytR/AlgR family response regulator